MKKMQKIISLTLIALVLFVCAFITGCSSKSTGIIIQSGDEPRLTYVQGQALDLSEGTLTIEKKKSKENETISLASPEVVVSGYDANKLGEQMLTVSYDGFETTMKVKVIARMVVSGHKVDYLLGDEFDKSKGTVTIAKDDGTTFVVPMKDDKITVTGFDSDEIAVPLALTVTYQSDDVTYQGTFNVSIKKAEAVKIILPTRKEYASHETELDLTGGQVIITFNGKQTAIPISKDMISGFDPSVATIDNRKETDNLLSQQVTISCAGEQKTFDIEVYFSGVSLMKLRASQFDDIDWDAESSQITPDEVFGPQAIDAMEEYFKLSKEEKALITTAEKEKVVRHAIAYGRVQLNNAAAALNKTCLIMDGVFVWKTDGSHSDAEAAALIINDNTSEFVTFGRLLYEIKTEFGKSELVPNALVENNIPEAFSESELIFARNLLAYLLELHDLLADIKTNWTIDDVTSSSALIKTGSIVSKIMNSEYTMINFAPVYDMLSAWREKDDYFEIVYASYYYGGDAKREMIKTEMFQSVPLPKMMQELYVNIANGYFLAQEFVNSPTQTIWAETIDIFESYRNILRLQKDIEKNGSAFCKELYEYLDMEKFADNNLIFVNGGYKKQVLEMFGDDEFEALWEAYLFLFEYANENNEINFDDADTSKAFADMFKMFVEASPSWQYSFIASMHNQYRDFDRYTKENILALDYSNGEAKSTFVYLFATYFQLKFTYEESGEGKVYQNAQKICEELFKAIELYALRYKYDTMDDFCMVMEDVEYKYKKLSGAEKVAFDQTLGYCYTKYLELYQMIESTSSTDFGGLSDTVDQMKESLALFFEIESIVKSATKGDDEKAPFYPLLFVAYEKAVSCAATIKAYGNTALLYAYFNDEFQITDGLNSTLDYALWKARDTFISTMLSSSFTVTGEDGNKKSYYAWKLYEPSGIQSFLADAYYIMSTQYKNGTFNPETVLAVMEKYRSTDMKVMVMFYNLGCDDMYYEGLEQFLNTFANDTKALGIQLLEVEQAYKTYALDLDNADAAKAFKDAMDAAIEAYDAIVSTSEYNANLKAFYEFYLAKYNEMNSAE